MSITSQHRPTPKSPTSRRARRARREAELERPLHVSPLMGPADPVSEARGAPVVGSRFDLLAGSDPGTADHLFTPKRPGG
jgi:hypothetical protein